jgi:hypothetical protein
LIASIEVPLGIQEKRDVLTQVDIDPIAIVFACLHVLTMDLHCEVDHVNLVSIDAKVDDEVTNSVHAPHP